MRALRSEALREAFLKFFEEHGHQRVASSGLIPADDPTLLFANAGMNQFKDVFLGREQRSYTAACSSQKCVRAGGKHNDLDNVGFTARHHTFFEMLGNFSFGDYFKSKAIELAWQFLTKELEIPADRLYVTVFDDDDEAATIWHEEIGVPLDRIYRFGEQDNFWSMGDTGPCGPCSEIFFDFGPDADGPDDAKQGIASGSDRFMEIWNLVFMQFDRRADGSMVPLPKPSVDTGMGLERVCAAVQGVLTNYETDLFKEIIQPVAEYLGLRTPYQRQTIVALHVLADHLRAMSFLIADGVVPSNEGRGYVLRRIMRRAMRFGKQLGQEQPFLYKLIPILVAKMGEAYPQLVAEEPQIITLVEVEEKQFDSTLSRGMPVLEKYLQQLKDDGADSVPGQVIFFLYGTHGFPVDLMEDVARDWGLGMDHEGYKQLMEADAKASGQEGDFNSSQVNPSIERLAAKLTTRQDCYSESIEHGQVRLILNQQHEVAQLTAGQEAEVVLDATPFYSESGGQIGDQGQLKCGDVVFQVTHTSKALDRLVVHHGKLVSGTLSLDMQLETHVDMVNRSAVMKNHTATHLLHQALRDELGLHVRQAGSLVDAEKTRFDFSHFAPIGVEQITRIEDAVNARILANTSLQVKVMPIEAARSDGAMALFGEKYGDQVRVVSIGNYSKELCGGTHVGATGEIGVFKIVSERALASGIRRLVAVTGEVAIARFQESEAILKSLSDLYAIKRENVLETLQKWQLDRKALEREVDELKMSLAKGGSGSEDIVPVSDFKVMVKRVSGVSGGGLRQLADEMMDRIKSGVVLLGSDMGDSAQLIVKVKLENDRIHAGHIVREMAQVVGGKGGGRPDMAMAGGKQVDQLDAALQVGLEQVQGKI